MATKTLLYLHTYLLANLCVWVRVRVVNSGETVSVILFALTYHATIYNINKNVGLKQLDNPIDLRRSNGDPPHPEGGVSSPEADGETLKQMSLLGGAGGR